MPRPRPFTVVNTPGAKRPKTPNDGASITRAEIIAMGDRILFVDFEMTATQFWHLLKKGGTWDDHRFLGIMNMAAKASSLEGGLGVNPRRKHPKKIKKA